MKASSETEAAIVAVMNEWMEHYENRNLDGLMGLVASDDDLFLFGTGIDEKRVGPEEFRYQAERDWAQTEALGFSLSSYYVSAAGPVAWVAAEGLGQGRVGGEEIQFPLRLTAVLQERDDGWRIMQSHISLPAAAQEEGDSVPV